MSHPWRASWPGACACLALMSAGGARLEPPAQDRTTTQPATQPSSQPSTQPAPRATAIAQANAMVLAFLDGDVARLRELATLRLNAQLEDDALRRLPAITAQEHGAFIAMGETIVRYDREDPSLSIVLCPVFLQRGMLAFSTVVNSGGLVTGFRISSFAPRGAAVPPPQYVDPALFTEETPELSALAGTARSLTLSLPRSAGRVPAVLILGMPEPHNRTESLGAIHIFRDIAQGLASHGIAAARFEEPLPRGGSAADRVHELPPALTAADVLAALDVLRSRTDIDGGRLYIVAHGFSAAVAAEAIAEDAARDPRQGGPVAGLVLCAAPARPALDVVLGHVDALAKLDGRILPDEQERIDEAIALRTGGASGQGAFLGAARADWEMLAALDAPAALRKAARANPALRVRIIHGNRDLQVTAADLAAWREAFAAQSAVEIQALPALDHILSGGEGLPSPFDYIRARPVAPELVLDIAEWVRPGSTTRPTPPATLAMPGKR